jgi:hypothetical protein
MIDENEERARRHVRAVEQAVDPELVQRRRYHGRPNRDYRETHPRPPMPARRDAWPYPRGGDGRERLR